MPMLRSDAAVPAPESNRRATPVPPQAAEQGAVHVRALASRDSLVALTALLNRAYAPLLARGLNFTASTQDVHTTRRRSADGQCLVADCGGVVVGTVTACGPYDEREVGTRTDVPWYRDPDIAHLQQFAVDTAFQRQGIGRLLVAAGERWAQERGFGSVALDTAEPATELIAMYRRLGYSAVGFMQWPGKTYRSVVMRKRLGQSALRQQLQTLARYNQWATQRLFNSVDLLADEHYRRNLGLFFKSVHGTLNHLLLAEHRLWFQRFSGGAGAAKNAEKGAEKGIEQGTEQGADTHVEPVPVVALNTEVEPDRHRLRQRLQIGAAAWLPWLDGVGEKQLLGDLHYRRSDGLALTLPFASTLLHVFNHGTHHRGQVTAALTLLGQRCPELDLISMLQAEKAAP